MSGPLHLVGSLPMLPHGVYGISSASSTGPEAAFHSVGSARALPSASCSLPASPLFDHVGLPCLIHALAPTHRPLGGWCPEYLKNFSSTKTGPTVSMSDASPSALWHQRSITSEVGLEEGLHTCLNFPDGRISPRRQENYFFWLRSLLSLLRL